jgi:hypothetical protein
VAADSVGAPSGGGAVDVSFSVRSHNRCSTVSVTLVNGTSQRPTRMSVLKWEYLGHNYKLKSVVHCSPQLMPLDN